MRDAEGNEIPLEAISTAQPEATTPEKKSRGGRPKRIHRMSIDDADAFIASRLPLLLERLMDLANGVQLVEYKLTDDGPSERIYRSAPDKDALKYLTERVMGKIPQRVELTGKEGGPVKVVPWMPEQAAIEKGYVKIIEAQVKELPSGA